MSQLAFDLPGVEVGKRIERIEYGVRFLADSGMVRKGEIEACDEHKARWLTAPETRDELPYHGYPRDLEMVTRTVVTFTGPWAVAYAIQEAY